jgi:anti-sigma factor RsiW
MKTFEERFTAWVDGKLTGADLVEFEKELASHPEAAAARADAEKLGRLLRAQPAPSLGNADFFNHQLMQRIAAESPRERVRAKASASFWSLPRMAWAGAFCLLAALVFFKSMIPSATNLGPGSKYFAQVVEAWPADPTISATTVYNPVDNVTVVWLDGLEAAPASYAMK